MGKPIIASQGRLFPSKQSDPFLKYTFIPTEIKTLKTKGNGRAVLVKEIQFKFQCKGIYNETIPSNFDGSGEGTILASSQALKCEDEAILLEEDSVEITYTGNEILPNGNLIKRETSVTVTITNVSPVTIYAQSSAD